MFGFLKPLLIDEEKRQFSDVLTTTPNEEERLKVMTIFIECGAPRP